MAPHQYTGTKENEEELPDVTHAIKQKALQFCSALEEIGNLAAEGGKPAETLMNVVALIGKRVLKRMCAPPICLNRIGRTWILAATVGLRQQCVGTLRMALNEGLAGLVAEQVQPVAVERAQNHPRFKYFSEAGEESYQSFSWRAPD